LLYSEDTQNWHKTCFQSINFEYCTAQKDYEDVVLYSAENEVLSIDSTRVIGKFAGVHNERNDTMLENMRNSVSFTVNFGNANVFWINKNKLWSGSPVF